MRLSEQINKISKEYKKGENMIEIINGILLLFSAITACYYWKDKLNIKTKEELEFEKRWEDCD